MKQTLQGPLHLISSGERQGEVSMFRSVSEPATLLSVTLDTPHHKRRSKRFKNATNVKITTVIRYLIRLLIKAPERSHAVWHTPE
jgi:hypothetical protein